MILYIFNVVGFLLAIGCLLWLTKQVREKSKALKGTEAVLDVERRRVERQADEIHGWRGLFGPFVSLYQNGPETTDCHNHDDKTVAIDLDGVILEYVDPWTGIHHFGDPIPGAIESLEKIHSLGYKIAIYTTRNNSMAMHNNSTNALELTALVQNQLEKHGIPYDFISMFKPLARYYIDDRAIRFTTWEQTMRVFRNLEVQRLIDRANEIERSSCQKDSGECAPVGGCCK